MRSTTDIDPAAITAAFLHHNGRVLHRGPARQGQSRGRQADTAIEGRGYRVVHYRGRFLKAHRVIWLLHHGQWPPDHVDHIDGDRMNNRIHNLRLATNRENLRNQRRTNPSGWHGIHKPPRGNWQFSIRADERRHVVRGYQSAFAAAMARDGLARLLHGDFASLNLPIPAERTARADALAGKRTYP